MRGSRQRCWRAQVFRNVFSMTNQTLRGDCARCAALCCVALAFDQSELFAFNKPPGEVCRHLDQCGRCAIHLKLAKKGFAGCSQYDCLGAGQRVTQEIFGGATWLEQPSLLGPMSRAFSLVYRLHVVLELLDQARRLQLSEEEVRTLNILENETQTLASAAATARTTEAIEARVQAFLRTLKHRVATTRKVDAL